MLPYSAYILHTPSVCPIQFWPVQTAIHLSFTGRTKLRWPYLVDSEKWGRTGLLLWWCSHRMYLFEGWQRLLLHVVWEPWCWQTKVCIYVHVSSKVQGLKAHPPYSAGHLSPYKANICTHKCVTICMWRSDVIYYYFFATCCIARQNCLNRLIII